MTLAVMRKVRITAVFLTGLLLFGAASAQTESARGAARVREHDAQKSAEAANPDPAKEFYAATSAAPKALKDGNFDLAEALAADLLKQAEQWEKNWNYGNAIHIGNLVLGHVALERGKIDDAKAFLLKAGKTPGSPQLNSFGPNMKLAGELLAKGEKQVVLDYLQLIKAFWLPEHAKADKWKPTIESGSVPDFGANLKYGF